MTSTSLGSDDLVVRAFAAWDAARRQLARFVVYPSVPILYFGDLEAYMASDRRVVTVALNPSKEEFPRDDPFRRFPGAGDGRDPVTYLGALNAYFETNPYRAWFSSFEPLLNGMGTSYDRGAENTAVHTDLCSPVPTDPTWSRLDSPTQRSLISLGSPLWHDLIRLLRPDVMLISLARSHLAKIDFEVTGSSEELYRVAEGRSLPYVVETWKVRLDDRTETRVVFGRAAQRPFSLISNAVKRRIGERAVAG